MTSRPAASSQGSMGHSSKRDNMSVSSNHSNSGRSERNARHPPVESAVTHLLVSIKQLLEALGLWSQLKCDETQVSDVYVRLGNDFNAAVAAFAAFNIDMSELLSVPEDLRAVLEQCLAEDATPDNLELYLPHVRQIITNLLQGLRGKQSIYRQVVADHKKESAHERTDSRSSRAEKPRRDGAQRSTLPRSVPDENKPEAGSTSRRSAPASKRRDMSPAAANGNGEDRFVGGFTLGGGPEPLEPTTAKPGSFHQRQPSTSHPFPQISTSPPRSKTPPLHNPFPSDSSSDVTIVAQPVVTPHPVPTSVQRFSLSDKPVPVAPAVFVEPSTPEDTHQRPGSPYSPSTTPPVEPLPAVANSLAALKNRDVLERRASKRFSTYNISKMTGASRERSIRSNPNRRSLAASSALTPGELAVLTEVDDEEEPPAKHEKSMKPPAPFSRPTTPEGKHEDIVVVPNGPVVSKAPQVEDASVSSRPGQTPEPANKSSRITVFLQLGREVKKVTVEAGLSFASLRVLFVDKFSYNPGMDNFPAIYIRDPSSGVQYELEDTEEVKEKCLLSLNIEPLDQIKQHIDSQISTLSQDLKELKTVISSTSRQSQFPDIVAQPLAESTPAPNRPTDKQFQHVARRLSRFVGDSGPINFGSQSPPPSFTQVQSQMTGQSLQQQMTGGSMLSDYSNRVVSDLKTQFDEVQNLRRDLGVMRQLYTEFIKQTKESLGNLRTQTQSVKQLANSTVGGARAFIDSGKKKLDVRSQNVLTEIEKLQDIVEGVKDDVIKKQRTPNTLYFKNIKKDIEKVSTELESLKEHILTIKPMWKKTWEEELQNIVEEQQFLTHQEEFLTDLFEDYKAVTEVYGHVEKVITLRGTSNGRVPRGRNFKPPPPEEGHNGLSTVMLEIRGAAVDPDKRLKAIEANQKNREKELASKSDDLQAELNEFVGQKKLKMTGGAEEVERVRQRRNDMTLKAMFTGGSASSMSSSSALGSAPDLSSPVSF